MRSVSKGSAPGLVVNQRDTESMPPGSSRSKNTSHASVVYSEFSVRAKAPAEVAAHVSMSEIWMTSNRWSVRVSHERASSFTRWTRGSVPRLV